MRRVGMSAPAGPFRAAMMGHRVRILPSMPGGTRVRGLPLAHRYSPPVGNRTAPPGGRLSRRVYPPVEIFSASPGPLSTAQRTTAADRLPPRAQHGNTRKH